jgi:phospholipid/cholesterol/gamma-HCH transport system ATP-binding protein
VAHYGDHKVLDGVTFDVAPGEVFVILGGSGCGKSTLLRHMLGLRQPSSGSIVIDGVNIAEADESEMQTTRRKIGMLFQGGALFSSMTLAENIALPLREFTGLDEQTIRSVASMKLGMVNLSGFEDHFPSEISGGMKKRAGLARAMALDPKILLFDEPSAGLDPITSAELDELILRISGALGTTVVVVTHELNSIAAIAQRAVLLDAGKALAVGTLDEIREQGGEMAQRFFDRQPNNQDSDGLDAIAELLEE